jgi:hypothetical protein
MTSFEKALGDAMAGLGDVDLGAVPESATRPGVARAAGLSSYYGTIEFTARMSDGGRWVQFNDEAANTGTASDWPEWAYDQAEKALLAGRHLYLVSSGAPAGNDLVAVYLECR